MNRLLSEDLPLRMSRVLGDFAENKPLPHRYGDLSEARFPLIKMTASKWFAADHPMTITQVFVDAEETAGWNFETESDGSGQSWTVVNLAAPAPADAEVSACGTGKRHPDSGALIDNPADIYRHSAARGPHVLLAEFTRRMRGGGSAAGRIAGRHGQHPRSTSTASPTPPAPSGRRTWRGCIRPRSSPARSSSSTR